MNAERIRQATRVDEIEGRFDGLLLGATLALAAIGVVMVGSSSLAVAEGQGVGEFHYLVRHLVHLGVGVALGIAVTRIELRDLERHGLLLLLLAFLLLMAVFLPGLGRTVNGARRWINLGPFGFQAVEAVKLMLIVWLASYLARHRDQVQRQLVGLLKPVVVVGGLVVLLMFQPDFGSAMLLVGIAGAMLFLGGVRIVHLVGLALLAMPLLATAAMVESYRLRRLTSFLDPWADPFKDGFQLTQALIAIGRGEIGGVGLGSSVQKLFYLPEAHTDFIFAVLAEETGLLGILVVMGLYALVAGRAFRIGLRAVEMGRSFAGHCAFGIGAWLALQASVSIGVNLGVLPTKGLTLPLISAGGSSVLMTCVGLGLLQRIAYEVERSARRAALHRAEPVAVAPAAESVPVLEPVPLRRAAREGRPLRVRIEPRLGEVAG